MTKRETERSGWLVLRLISGVIRGPVANEQRTSLSEPYGTQKWKAGHLSGQPPTSAFTANSTRKGWGPLGGLTFTWKRQYPVYNARIRFTNVCKRVHLSCPNEELFPGRADVTLMHIPSQLNFGPKQKTWTSVQVCDIFNNHLDTYILTLLQISGHQNVVRGTPGVREIIFVFQL